jgi:hypothetical protein
LFRVAGRVPEHLQEVASHVTKCCTATQGAYKNIHTCLEGVYLIIYTWLVGVYPKHYIRLQGREPKNCTRVVGAYLNITHAGF